MSDSEETLSFIRGFIDQEQPNLKTARPARAGARGRAAATAVTELPVCQTAAAEPPSDSPSQPEAGPGFNFNADQQ